MNKTNFVRSDLRFLLPIQPEQKIVVLGNAPEMVEVLNASGYAVINLLPDISNDSDGKTCQWNPETRQSLPIATANIDHVLVPLLIHQQTDWIFGELTRVLKPGGWLFLGFYGNPILNWIGVVLGKRRMQNKACFSVDVIRNLIMENDCLVLNVYGVYRDLSHPRYLVPLENPGVAYHLFDQFVVPRSWQTEFLRRLAAIMIRLGLQTLVFKDFGLVAQRS